MEGARDKFRQSGGITKGSLFILSARRMQLLTGHFGVVLEFDAATMCRTREIIVEAKLSTAAYVVFRPHMTFYHAPFRALPLDAVNSTLMCIAEQLTHSVRLTALAPYNGGFVFWDAERSAELDAAHATALRLGKYVDTAEIRSHEPAPGAYSEAELANLRRWGYPLVGGLFRPHITIAKFADSAPAKLPVVGTYVASAERVTFAEMGTYGQITRVITVESIWNDPQ